jgi:glucokinase
MPDMTLGVDLSDIVARLVIVNEGGQVLSRGEVPPSAANRANGVREAAKRAIAGAGAKVSGVAVALQSAGEPVPADVATALAEATSRTTEVVPVAAGTAAALAEHWCGAARGVKHVITFAIAEHVTAGVLVDGRPWAGAHGLASSVGWLALNPVEREDYRRFGGLEAEVSSAGTVRRFVWRIKSGDRSAVADQARGDFSKITADDIFQGARSGDGVSVSVMRDTAKYIGMAIANMATLFDPEIIVLGGTIAAAGDTMLEAIKVECARRLQPQQVDQIRIVLSTLGLDAVAIGAARASARAHA